MTMYTLYSLSTSVKLDSHQITTSLGFQPKIEMKTSPVPSFGNEITELTLQSTGDANVSEQMLSFIAKNNTLSIYSIKTTSETVMVNETTSARMSIDVEKSVLTHKRNTFSATTVPENENESRSLSTSMFNAAETSTSTDGVFTTSSGFKLTSESSSTVVTTEAETSMSIDNIITTSLEIELRSKSSSTFMNIQ